jgi:two-component system sensor histidine kinase KdpD
MAMMPDEQRKLHVTAGDISSVMESRVISQMHVAQSAYERGQMAGWGTDSAPATEVLYVPLRTADMTVGILALRPRDRGRFLLDQQVSLLESLARQVALALEVELTSVRRMKSIHRL